MPFFFSCTVRTTVTCLLRKSIYIRKVTLTLFWQHFMEGHAKSAPISRLPLITILDTKHYLKDVPVCQVISINYLSFFSLHTVLLDIASNSYLMQPFHLDLNFFNKENRVLHYPVRAFYVEGSNLMAYNISSGVENIYKKLYASVYLIVIFN